jgi:sugar phosphate isomerase/epimerase
VRLGLFTPIFNGVSLAALIDALKRYPQITMLELGTGGWPGASHLPFDELLNNPSGIVDYKRRLADAGLGISALSCHGNPVHPDKRIAERDAALLEGTIHLAEQMEVPVVVTFSGCPGGGPQDRTPNWIVAAWPPDFSEALEWQWSERLIPFWRTAASWAAGSGVKIALEAHPGFSVYNPESVLRLRHAVGNAIGINLDPSHLWWQGMEIPAVIEMLGNAIFHFHAKDVAIHPSNTARNGVLDTKSYRQIAERSWLFRSVGWGHSELEWKQIVSALRVNGYDYVLSIEHEDALASTHEGLSSAIGLLSRVILREPPVESWWA